MIAFKALARSSGGAVGRPWEWMEGESAGKAAARYGELFTGLLLRLLGMGNAFITRSQAQLKIGRSPRGQGKGKAVGKDSVKAFSRVPLLL